MVFEKRQCYIANYRISIFAFSIMGKGKVENQDSFRIYNDGEQVIISVADGLGSAAFSKEGSNRIVEKSNEVLSKNDPPEMIAGDILKQWKQGLEGNLSQYDTTLKFVKISEDIIRYGGVGDGWIAFLTNQGVISLSSDNAFSNQTDSILSFDLNKKFLLYETNVTNNQIGLIATDGFSEDMDKENAEHLLADIEMALLKDEELFVSDMKQTLENWPVETNCDDKTVVVLMIKKEGLTK